MISIIIPYFNNSHGLAVTLILLQQQTVLPQEIIIIDNSENQEGLSLARRYKMNVNIRVFKKCDTIYESWNIGIVKSAKNDLIIINDDLLIPLNFIETIKSALKSDSALCYVPETPEEGHRVSFIKTQKFVWLDKKKKKLVSTTWMPGFCFALPRETIENIGVFDTQFKIWFGDRDYELRIRDIKKNSNGLGIAKIKNLYVYHYGASSFNLRSNLVKDITNQDHARFCRKHNYLLGEI